MTRCLRCRRELTNPDSVAAGLGPDCRARMVWASCNADDEAGTVADLPFDPQTCDIVCRRDANGGKLHFNISQQIVHHSPSGFEWGYAGSGPADFALNILALFIGKKQAMGRWYPLHQELKRDFVQHLPPEGGTIRGPVLIAWLQARIPGWAQAPLTEAPGYETIPVGYEEAALGIE